MYKIKTKSILYSSHMLENCPSFFQAESLLEKSWFEKWSARAVVLPSQLEEMISPLKNKLLAQLKTMDECDSQIKKIRANLSQMTQDTIEQYKDIIIKKQIELNEYQKKIKQAHREFKQQLKMWKIFLKKHPALLAL